MMRCRSVVQVFCLGVAVVLCGCILNSPPARASEAMAGVEYLPREPKGYWGPGYSNALLLPNGRLMAWYDAGKDWSDEQVDNPDLLQQALARYSSDNGYTWSEPEILFSFPQGKGKYSAEVPMLDRDGNIHLFGIHFFYGDGTKLEGKCLPFHVMSTDGGRTWSPPQHCDFGHEYTGDCQSAIQRISCDSSTCG